MILKKSSYLKDTDLRQIKKLAQSLTKLKGVGPKRAMLMSQKGLHTILDLLFFTPIRYEDRTRISPLKKIEEGPPVLVRGRVVYGREEFLFPSRKQVFKLFLQDGGRFLELLWFHYRKSYLAGFISKGTELLVYGTVKRNRGRLRMIHPEITVIDNVNAEGSLGFYPVYSTVQGISSNILRTIIRMALDEYLTSLVDPVPCEITGRLGLPDLPCAIKDVHLPPKESSIDHLNIFHTPAQKRLLFDRFFLVMLAIAFSRKSRERMPGPIFRVPPGLKKDLAKFFPFMLTTHQTRAMEDLVNDFQMGRPMARLLMGDVGSGKTAVAAVAAHVGILNNFQVALMVPTQVLANQHLEYFSSLSEKMGFRPVLLTGKLKKDERRDIYDKIKDGWYNLIIGTQSLIQEKLSFAKLGLVIIDEQHRFGVRERALMHQKGNKPHLLVMTATPIPRTLAMTIYGDMDISIIKGYPEGHRHVVTRLSGEGQKRAVFDNLMQRMSAGQQAFVICPVIEGSEEVDLKNAVEMAERLEKIFAPKYRTGLIHGRLSPEEREEVMDKYRKGQIHLLVGTTVIEVGVHVPKATVMIIEHPERFGLTQLHQLRGRIGRGSEGGICFLMKNKNLSEKAIYRLNVLVENHDGFAIAQKDLELRGHGELTGMRQSGIGELDFTEMIRESDLLLMAKREAQRLIDHDPELTHPENNQLRVMVESVLAGPLDL
ncbi:MAG: ATP-dependent DNA helicase RecG [Thermodesulfobacteriota bacterium]|nr:ATP-dependent DNA helicase RecG [Thermodesulfobacteriota bacterium]